MSLNSNLKMGKRTAKGESLLEFKKDYIIIDIETTDFSKKYGDIIEIAGIKYKDHEEVAEYHTLVKLDDPIPEYITRLTGITDDDLLSGKHIKEALLEFKDFIDGDVLVAHNANFDINFIYDSCIENDIEPITNDFIDTLRLSRFLVKDTENHKLNTLVRHFDLVNEEKPVSHRAMEDVKILKKLYDTLYNIYSDKPELLQRKRRKRKRFDFSKMTKDTGAEIDPENYFYGKNICFSGKMTTMTKKEGAQIVVNLGAKTQNNVTTKTDVLILGDIDLQKDLYGSKSNKHKKADSLIADGQDIEILFESDFLEKIED